MKKYKKIRKIWSLLQKWSGPIGGDLYRDGTPIIIVNPDTFNEDMHDVTLFNVVTPDTFNDDIHDVTLFNVVVPDIFKFAVTFTPDVFIEKYSIALIGSS